MSAPISCERSGSIVAPFGDTAFGTDTSATDSAGRFSVREDRLLTRLPAAPTLPRTDPGFIFNNAAG